MCFDDVQEKIQTLWVGKLLLNFTNDFTLITTHTHTHHTTIVLHTTSQHAKQKFEIL